MDKLELVDKRVEKLEDFAVRIDDEVSGIMES